MLEDNAPQQGIIQQEQGQQQEATAPVDSSEESYKIISGQMLNLLYESEEPIMETLRTGGQQESATVLASIHLSCHSFG